MCVLDVQYVCLHTHFWLLLRSSSLMPLPSDIWTVHTALLRKHNITSHSLSLSSHPCLCKTICKTTTKRWKPKEDTQEGKWKQSSQAFFVFPLCMFHFLTFYRGARTRTILVKWRYIHQMKALNELFLLAKVLSSMSVHIFIINNWNQYTKSDQSR